MTNLSNQEIEQLNKYLNLIASQGFPVREYTPESLKDFYHKLTFNDTKKISNTGIQLVEHFHPSIWRCNVNGCPAPIDAWNNLELMVRVILNRFKYLETTELDLMQIRAGLSISKIAPKVSIFRPALAKYLINKYLNDYNIIFDPCAGFSGRMLGTCCLGKQYIGQDINSITVRETNNMINFLNLDAQVNMKDSIYDSGNYECLFTCPPYSDKEIWHQDIEILSSDEWIDVCLNNYKCDTYLFVVDNTDKYKDYIVETIDNKSHFNTNSEKIILIRNTNKSL